MDEPAVLPPTARGCDRRSGDVRVEVGAQSAWLYGAGLASVCDKLGTPWMPDRHPDREGALMVPIDRADDVLAVIEHREGRAVELTAVDR